MFVNQRGTQDEDDNQEDPSQDKRPANGEDLGQNPTENWANQVPTDVSGRQDSQCAPALARGVSAAISGRVGNIPAKNLQES